MISFADAGIELAPGEQLAFTLAMTNVYENEHFYLRASSDVYDGGTLLYDGGAVPGEDLSFKVVVQ